MDVTELEQEFWSQVEHATERHGLPNENNRRHIWDYFFKDEYDRVGGRQLNRIASLRVDQSIAELVLKEKQRTAYKIFGGAAALFLLAVLSGVGFLFGLAVLYSLA